MERKLYKSSNDKVFAGVCGGIGEYFGVDSVIIRLIWVVFTLMAGAGLIAYIIAAIIIPEKNSNRSSGDTYYNSEETEPARHSSGMPALGIILIILGGIVLLKNFIPWIPEEIFLAALLIGLGIFFITKKNK